MRVQNYWKQAHRITGAAAEGCSFKHNHISKTVARKLRRSTSTRKDLQKFTLLTYQRAEKLVKRDAFLGQWVSDIIHYNGRVTQNEHFIHIHKLKCFFTQFCKTETFGQFWGLHPWIIVILQDLMVKPIVTSLVTTWMFGVNLSTALRLGQSSFSMGGCLAGW